MAKDPSFLWYPNKYVADTMGMTLKEKGLYVDLLMMQFFQGHMNEETIERLIGDDGWPVLLRLFEEDDEGLWYNKDLEREQSKREDYIESRRRNKANSPVEDMPVYVPDPNFQMQKNNVNDVVQVCEMATMIYKNTEYASQIQPMVINLLAQMDVETLIKAIKNVAEMFDNNNRPHDKRPGFARQFCSAKAVKEMAERPAQPVAAPESKSRSADQAWLDKKED